MVAVVSGVAATLRFGRVIANSVHECAPDHSTHEIEVGELREAVAEMTALYEALLNFVVCYPPELQISNEHELEQAGCDPVEAALVANAVRALSAVRGDHE